MVKFQNNRICFTTLSAGMGEKIIPQILPQSIAIFCIESLGLRVGWKSGGTFSFVWGGIRKATASFHPKPKSLDK